MNLDKVIDERRSVREFSDKKVKWADVLEAVDSARKAPLAGNHCNFKFIIIEDSKKKNKLAEVAEQYWIADAPMIVIVCSDDAPLENIYYDRGKIYARQQAGAAIENFLLKITDMGLSCCWVGAFPDEIVKQILKIPNHIHVEAILPVGYAKFKTKAPKKSSLEKIISWESWGTKKRPTGVKDPRTM
ncbi:hypothetical protein CO038_01955 [Candidatus Pacearchaeota archaeon CG_4_9_14_0_2_um_filter_39_13]|nr:hypothetical protein [Candidatus Pacearchaeota archaeon]OIO43861.1 MAG: hypothetical protein AUJ64_01015 [Candidatus Pacearchaeota archaeon CG1_02_39_14]PJC44710.1 MAG: hypothetical protein CO038_01955 [Candidatus Pacearchaeota archaeon CG_4_9_14_0_2_um_filter_39_13]